MVLFQQQQQQGRKENGWAAPIAFLTSGVLLGCAIVFFMVTPAVLRGHQTHMRQDSATTLIFGSDKMYPRERILANNVALPDYYCTKSFHAELFVHSKDQAARRDTRVIRFALKCHTQNFEYHLAVYAGATSSYIAYANKIIPTPLLVSPLSDQKGENTERRRCALVAIPGNPRNDDAWDNNRSLLIEWSLVLTPRFHWTDGIPRALSDEFYRALSLSGLHSAPPRGSDYKTWYDIQEDEDYDSGASTALAEATEQGKEVLRSRNAKEFALAFRESELDRVFADPKKKQEE